MTKNQRSGLASRCPNFLMEFHKVQCKKLLWTPTLVYPPKHGPLYLVGFVFCSQVQKRVKAKKSPYQQVKMKKGLYVNLQALLFLSPHEFFDRNQNIAVPLNIDGCPAS